MTNRERDANAIATPPERQLTIFPDKDVGLIFLLEISENIDENIVATVRKVAASRRKDGVPIGPSRAETFTLGSVKRVHNFPPAMTAVNPRKLPQNRMTAASDTL